MSLKMSSQLSRLTSNSPAASSFSHLKRRVQASRWVLFAALLAVAVGLGFGASHLLSESEAKLAQEQFESISDRALDMAAEIALRQRLGLVTMAAMAEQTFPDEETWPYVDFKGFEVISNSLIATSSGQNDLGLLPLVTPDQLDEFNKFGADLYPDAPFDRVTGLDAVFARYNESDGETYWGSPNKIFIPFLFHSRGPILHLANLHSIESRGILVDELIACSDERAEKMESHSNDTDFVPTECSILTDITDLSNRVENRQPAAIAFLPLYPANDPTHFVGLLSSSIKWKDVLVNVFSSEVSGIDCVIETGTQAVTYHVAHGRATLKSEDDAHDQAFSHYGRTILLNTPGLYSIASANYTLTLYPSGDFFDVYTTNNPTIATVGAVCTILVTSILFILYDTFVRQESHHKAALLQSKRAFVRFIGHEVRTPLNAVSLGLQLMRDEIVTLTTSEKLASDKEQMQQQLANWEGQAEDNLEGVSRAVECLNDLLLYDKVENDNLKVELTVFSIWPLIERTVAEFKLQAQKKGISINPRFFVADESQDDADSETPGHWRWNEEARKHKVVGDSVRITQCIRNLISNSLKFTPEGGKITLRAYWEDPESKTQSTFLLDNGEEVDCFKSGILQFEVQDTGAGMTQSQVSKVFGQGVQFNVNKLQAGQGSGLGLYISKGIIDKHGGNLSVASEGLGFGTTFTMTLPLFHVPSKDLLTPETGPSLAKVTYKRLRILVCDDALVNQKLLIRLLENKGHVCAGAEHGLAAVQLVKNAIARGDHFDSILMDYEMPVMKGPEAAKEIRGLGCDSFLVGVTGNLFDEDVAYFIEHGANAVLPKPLDLHALEDLWAEYHVAVVEDQSSQNEERPPVDELDQEGEEKPDPAP